MKLTYIYSACIKIETNDCSIICDPWFTQGAFGGTWYHFPFKEIKPIDLGFFDYIYISHIHPDHYDHIWVKEYIELFPETKVIIANWGRPSPLAQKMKRDGIEYQEITDLIINDTKIKILPHETGSKSDIDSALIVSSEKELIVNMNDCIWDESFYRKVNKISDEMTNKDRFKIGLFSYTSAGPYPHTYWFDTPELKSKSDFHKQKFLDHYQSKINTISCDINIPFAGQFILGGEASVFNNYRGICDATEVYKFDSKAKILFEFCEGYVDLNTKEVHGIRKEPFSEEDLEKRTNEIKKCLPYYSNDVNDSLASKIRLKPLIDIAFKKALNRSRENILYNYILNVDEQESYSLDLSEGLLHSGTKINSQSDVINHTIFIKKSLLISLLLGIEHWDNAEKGSMYMSRRTPDIFVRKAQSFLHFFCI